MAVTPKTLTIKFNLAPLRWSLHKFAMMLVRTMNHPLSATSKWDQDTIRALGEHMDVLEVLADGHEGP